MDSPPHNPALAAGATPRAVTVIYWIVTALFCLEMIFTAYYERLVLPQVAEAFARLDFPAACYGQHRIFSGAVCIQRRPSHDRGSPRVAG